VGVWWVRVSQACGFCAISDGWELGAAVRRRCEGARAEASASASAVRVLRASQATCRAKRVCGKWVVGAVGTACLAFLGAYLLRQI
jgi:hypothetical protein